MGDYYVGHLRGIKKIRSQKVPIANRNLNLKKFIGEDKIKEKDTNHETPYLGAHLMVLPTP